jgi:hypothetical protein
MSTNFDQYFLCMRWWFSRSFKSFSLPYKIINFLFASLKLLTNFANAYWNLPQNLLLCDWSMLSIVPTSPWLQGKCARINLSQAASGKLFQCQNRRFMVFEAGYLMDFKNYYVPETHFMYFIRRCWFLKCSEHWDRYTRVAPDRENWNWGEWRR